VWLGVGGQVQDEGDQQIKGGKFLSWSLVR
jgi:hypothetical protein